MNPFDVRPPWERTPEERRRVADLWRRTVSDPEFLAQCDRIYGDGVSPEGHEWRRMS